MKDERDFESLTRAELDGNEITVPRTLLEEAFYLITDLGNEPSTPITFNDAIQFVAAQLKAFLT